MPPFRLVASDIDGTLIRTDGTLSPRTIGVLDQLHSRGVPTVLVTGRPVRWLRQLYDQMAEPLPAVCANGAVVYDPAADKILRAAPLSVELLLDVTQQLREAVPDVALAVEVEDGRSFWYEEKWPLHWDGEHKQVRVLSSPEELTSVPAVKLLARSASYEPDEFAALISSTLGEVAVATHSSKSALVEISAAGVTKAAGLAWFCERDGFTAEDVVAFGDMPNDLPLLAWAGRSVAMGNAHPAVREVADEVTLTNDEDGVAVYLEKLFDL
ncbi:HAD family hydrolase [Actinoplanes friuliensis]|jgi:Cof subfamily protein (haloacid dehalogenase superfamily)|uniref:Putative haloacid dehalogenase-like hydrolase n=1 Tax=Actinoplanes friuliensis DSM 7358 TaxID=1246995 RepID=U5WC90_9ACTN|nr:HAD family hydrolase [Actinoplanes friuliensis]AGZ46774.1 putative haloacid dehalogenase-like hydrolase [Actinoplanes friuliensis DSM 7358]